MAINFPLSPSPNEIYSYNGLSWQWNGSYWQSFPPSSGATGVVRTITASTGLSANTTTGDVTILFTGSTGSNFTGGTVTGATSFTGGLSANTISATTYNNYPGSSSSYCVPTFYVSSISGCSPVTILTPLNAVGGLNVTGTTNFTQTVDFSGGLTASTISATTYFNLPVSAVTNGTGISALTSNGIVTITNTQVQGITGKTDGVGISSSISNNVISITNTGVTSLTASDGISGNTTTGGINIVNTDKGSSQNIFKNIQSGGITQFSAGSNSDNLNFSGINITITSAATNTLVFSAGTGGGGAVSSVTAGTGLSGNSTTGAITIINTGVTQITAGSGISIDQSTGNVTITATGGGGGLTFQQVQMIAFLTS
jgi:hypothetical protein